MTDKAICPDKMPTYFLKLVNDMNIDVQTNNSMEFMEQELYAEMWTFMNIQNKNAGTT